MGLGYTEEKVSSSKCSGLMRGIAFALECGKMKFRVVARDALRKSLRFIFSYSIGIVIQYCNTILVFVETIYNFIAVLVR